MSICCLEAECTQSSGGSCCTVTVGLCQIPKQYTRAMTLLVLQMKDLRGGALTKHLQQCAVVEASVQVLEDGEVEAAERAVLSLSQRLDPVVKMASAH